MRMIQFQKHFLYWLRDRLPDDGFYTFPAMAARLTPGDLGNQMRELLNRRQRAAGQPDIVPYIPTMSPPRTAFTGQISANRQLVFGEMSFARVRAISKKAATTMNNVVMRVRRCGGPAARGPAAGAGERHTLQHSRLEGAAVCQRARGRGRVASILLPPGGRISITLQSHVDLLCFGFIRAPEKTGDLWPLVGYMNDALTELEPAIAERSWTSRSRTRRRLRPTPWPTGS
jgi:hypothetical protein